MKKVYFSALFIMLNFSGCGGKFISPTTTATTSVSQSALPGESEPGARIIFNKDNFVDLNKFATAATALTSINSSHQCLGDVLRVYYVDGDDYLGVPTAMPTPSFLDDLLPTNRPSFVRNVSVDITNTYYPTTQSSVLATDGCSYRALLNSPAPSSCADFDRIPAATPAPTIAPTPVPNPVPVASATPSVTDPGANEYFGSNFYRVRDTWCTSQGDSFSPDPSGTTVGVGGVSIDLDRTQLGSKEDLLMLVTYHSMNSNPGMSDPDHLSSAGNWPASHALDKNSGTAISGTETSLSDKTVLKVSLIGTQQSLETLLRIPQPRPWAYSSNVSYPIYMKEIATLEDPFGSLRTEQVYIPLSQNGLIDRIRIDRVRGSYHLFQVDLYRLGNRSE